MIRHDEERLKILARVRQERGGTAPARDIIETEYHKKLVKTMRDAGWIDIRRSRGVVMLRITTKGRIVYKCFLKICG